jgi:Ca2+-binding EF-hand superfamily protein
MLAGGFDKKKIAFSTFIREFQILRAEDAHNFLNQLVFKLFDVDRDGYLNIMNLLHI